MMTLKLRTQGWLNSSPLEGEPNCARTTFTKTQVCERNLVGGVSPASPTEVQNG